MTEGVDMARKSKDYSMYKDMQLSNEQMRAQLYKLARVANSRLSELEKHNEMRFAYEKAMEFFDDRTPGKNRFSTSQRQTDKELRREFNAIVEFLSSKSSTITGLKLVYENARKRIEKQIQKSLEDENFKITNWKEFETFLKSKEWKKLKKRVDSDQVMEDFALALQEDTPIEEIYAGYREFLDTEMTFEQVSEKRAASKLLH